MFKNLNKYNKYIHIVKKFTLEEDETPGDYARAWINSWQKIGLWDEKCESIK